MKILKNSMANAAYSYVDPSVNGDVAGHGDVHSIGTLWTLFKDPLTLLCRPFVREVATKPVA